MAQVPAVIRDLQAMSEEAEKAAAEAAAAAEAQRTQWGRSAGRYRLQRAATGATGAEGAAHPVGEISRLTRTDARLLGGRVHRDEDDGALPDGGVNVRAEEEVAPARLLHHLLQPRLVDGQVVLETASLTEAQANAFAEALVHVEGQADDNDGGASLTALERPAAALEVHLEEEEYTDEPRCGPRPMTLSGARSQLDRRRS